MSETAKDLICRRVHEAGKTGIMAADLAPQWSAKKLHDCLAKVRREGHAVSRRWPGCFAGARIRCFATAEDMREAYAAALAALVASKPKRPPPCVRAVKEKIKARPAQATAQCNVAPTVCEHKRDMRYVVQDISEPLFGPLAGGRRPEGNEWSAYGDMS